ncbi:MULTISPECIES: phage major capsid protein [Rhodopseudomonas]|uniref:Capsid protein n=1 Tax=Rhodopseudomonas palustris TaxID=1076 RepID=A0A0D7E8R8_RHOPL|nr:MULTISPECIES: phage major capsid protein [Rhodopseudomonas]KIZ37219.1 capsid protein [Rhodopseudomonas palustris]MDF3811089.1 phage major capsid protein [Rhodopseudomonas sp. BAL398]WOK19975.1 phage major capsid protein [Rhodopseudomonas sp. BAL398]
MDYDINDTAPEHKAGFASVNAHDDLLRTHDEFKAANDERLNALERRQADVLLEEKVDRINGAIDARLRRIEEFALKQARPALEGRARIVADSAAREHKSAFDAYVRSGDVASLRALESKALSVGSNPDGGYLVPVELEHSISARLTAISPIRAIASVREISGSVYKKPFMTAGPATGWVGETDARTQTTSPTLDALSFPAMELYAMPAATATLLDDSAVNIDEWIASEVELTFAVQEGAAFVNGDGVNKPKGFLSYPTAANAAWSWGNLGYLATGAAGAFPADDPSDVLVDLIYALKAGYRQNGVFVMNRKTQAQIRKFKDASGSYLWQPPAQAGGRASLMTFPLIEAEDMPDVAANSLSVAFGDFRRGYLVVDRLGVRVLRDPYSSKPYVLFYTTKRVGGGVQDFDAIKLLKFAAS